ncbi:hypothetical protein Dip510_002170 [Elusimicrobium posterum]|uniref:hypothetical protein n=1 Tax=Elusimicrobium posterum TaxID=3116653 RepID=UPI003C75C25F
MWQCDYKQDAKINLEKLWNLFSDVSKWTQWNANIESARLGGDFKEGAKGYIKLKDQPDQPFTVTSIEAGKKLALRADIMSFGVSIIFENIAQAKENGVYSIENKITVEGGLASLVGITMGAKLKEAVKKSVEKVIELAA